MGTFKIKVDRLLPFCFIGFVVILKIFLSNEIKLFNLASWKFEERFEYQIPISQILFEPFVGLTKYYSIFYKEVAECILLIPQLFLISLAIFRNFARALILTPLILLLPTFFLNHLFQYKLLAKKGYVFSDLHSHTSFSHDGYAGVKKNILWHISAGKEVFAITDHNRIEGALLAKEFSTKKIIVGMEVSTEDGKHLLVFGEPAVYFKLKGKKAEEVIKIAHQNGGVVIAAHPWENSLENYGDVDGFEIFSSEKKNPEIEEIIKVRRYCLDKNLLMLCGSNWHGFGFCMNWNVFRIDDRESDTILQILKCKDIKRVEPLVLADNTFFSDTSPIFYFLFYFSSLNFLQIVSWFFWLFLFRLDFFIKKFK